MIVGRDYTLISIIGMGGTGVVYKAKHNTLDEIYALKILSPHQINKENWLRFVLEAKVIAKLDNPHIVKIFNMGIHEQQCPYYVMELLKGTSLAEYIEQNGPVDKDRCIDIFIAVCDALAAAHKNNIVHRDVKPANIMLIDKSANQNNLVKLVDFGIVRLTKEDSKLEQAQTVNGDIFGSPHYLSPEQCSGLKADERSDLYSLGCAMFQALTGHTPFESSSAYEVMTKHIDQPPTSLFIAAPHLSFDPAIELMVKTLLQKDPAKRYQTAQQVGHDLSRIKEGKPIGMAVVKTPPKAVRNLPKEPLKVILPPVKPSKSLFERLFVPVALLGVVTLLIGGSIFFLKERTHDQPVAQAPKSIEKKVADEPPYIAPRIAIETPNSAEDFLSSTVTDARGNTVREFHFAKGLSIGTYITPDGKPHKAEGIVDLPLDQPLCIYFSSFIENVLPILDRFGPDDLYDVRISTEDLPAAINIMSRWHKLTGLNLKRCLIKDSQVKDLDRLKNLRSLQLERSPFDLEALTHLQLFTKLQKLSLSRVPGISQFLPYLSRDHSLKSLTIMHTTLQKADFAAIASLKNLEDLTIFQSSKVDTMSGATQLARMPRLKKLTLLANDWNQEDLNILKRKIRNVIVREEAPSEDLF